MLKYLVLYLLVKCSQSGLVRVPKIYNALITSDENLSPSHVYPVVEPVIRTTALGVAFPPIIVQPTVFKEQPKDDENNEKPSDKENEKVDRNKTDEEKEDSKPDKKVPEVSFHGSLFPLAFDPYFPHSYTPEFLFPALPFYHQPIFVDIGHYGGKTKENPNKQKKEKEEISPIATANLKKNPDIPDVPPPPLPVKDIKKKRGT